MFISILQDYFVWHYTKALGEILHVWANFFWFVTNFFSFSQLTRSFFSPWKRMTEDLHKGFNFEELVSFFIIGLLSRLVGIIMRSFIMLFGLIGLIILLVAILILYLFWFLAPALIFLSLFYGVALMLA